MSRLLAILVGLAAGICQATLYPWISLFGTSIPIVPVVLAAVGLWQPSLIVLTAAAAGLAVDLFSTTPLGVWTVYYVVAGLLFKPIQQKIKSKAVATAIWIFIVVSFSAIYNQLVSATVINVQALAWSSLIPALVAALIIAIPHLAYQKRRNNR